MKMYGMESFTITLCLIGTYMSQYTEHIRTELRIGACASLLSTK